VLFSPRRHPVAAGLALLCAVGMALQAVLARHDASTTVGFELAVAIAYAVGGVIALDVRRPRAGLPARGIDRSSSAVAR
jgi:drug/metabolite transporter (DMT)-like permease